MRVMAEVVEAAAGAAVIRSIAAAIVAETPSRLKRRIPNPLVAPSVAPTVGERGSAGYRDLVRGWVGRPAVRSVRDGMAVEMPADGRGKRLSHASAPGFERAKGMVSAERHGLVKKFVDFTCNRRFCGLECRWPSLV